MHQTDRPSAERFDANPGSVAHDRGYVGPLESMQHANAAAETAVTTLLDLLSTAERNLARLSDPLALRDAAERVAQVAEGFGASYLVAASGAAERIVGAALVMHSQSLCHFDTSTLGRGGESVLVVDVNVASGTAMARAADAVRQTGALSVAGAALYGFGDTVGAIECGVDRLAVVHPLAGPAGS